MACSPRDNPGRAGRRARLSRSTVRRVVPIELYRQVFKSLPGLVLLLDRELAIIDASDAYCAVAGRAREALVGHNIFAAFPDDPSETRPTGERDLRASLLTVLRTRREDRLAPLRYPVPRPAEKGGGFEERYWSTLNRPILDERGEVALILHSTEDITELVRIRQGDGEQRALLLTQIELAEENARLALTARGLQARAEAERERLHRLFVDAPASIAILRGPDHVYELANSRYCQLVGRRDLVGRRGRDAIPEVESAWQMIDRVYRTGVAEGSHEFPAELDRLGNGQLDQGYFAFTAQPTTDAQGRVDGVFIVAIEVTAQVVARQALEAILARVPVPIALLEPGTARIIFSNKAADELWGSGFPQASSASEYEQFGATDLEGRPIPFDQLPAVRAARGEQISGDELQITTPRGKVWLIVDSASVPALPGHPAVVLVSFQDVTGLREAVRAREEFISIASHELNTPLTPIKLNLGALLSRSELGEPERRKLAVVQRQVNRLTKLVGELLEVSRITAGRFSLAPKGVEVISALREVLGQLFDEQGARQVTLHATGQAIAFVDPQRFEQVVTNLVSNALKYGEGKPIAITVSTADGLVAVSVRDEGIGIAQAMQERIFERFERAVSSRHYGGFGLGLWIVRHIVESSGGTIAVTSAPGAGSTFTFTLPCAQPHPG